jgi:hypothetical protein
MQLASTAQLNNYVAKNVISRHNCPRVGETLPRRHGEHGEGDVRGTRIQASCSLGALAIVIPFMRTDETTDDADGTDREAKHHALPPCSLCLRGESPPDYRPGSRKAASSRWTRTFLYGR